MHVIWVDPIDGKSEKFRVAASQIALYCRPDPETNPPAGVFEVLLKNDPQPGRVYWTYDFNPALLGV